MEHRVCDHSDLELPCHSRRQSQIGANSIVTGIVTGVLACGVSRPVISLLSVKVKVGVGGDLSGTWLRINVLVS